MSIEGIKSDFYNYLLESLKTSDDKSKKDKIGDLSDFSIFKYSKEFKEFLTDEYKVSSDILSMNISDILELNFKDGKLVKEDENEGTSETSTASDSDKTEDTNDKKNTDIIDVLNLMMEDEEFKNLFDEDKNGEISKDEFNNFLDLIKGLDENDKDISIDDVVKASDQYNKVEDNNNTSGQNNAGGSAGGSSGGGAGGVSGGGGSYGGGSYGGGSYGGGSSAVGSTTPANNANSSSETTSTGNYEGLSVEELQDELIEANNSLTDAMDKVAAAETAVQTARDEAQKDIDDKYDAYMAAIDADEETKNAIKEKADQIKEKEDLIRENKDLENDYDDKKSKAEQNIQTQTSIIDNCTQAIANLEGKIALLRASLDSAEEDDKSSIYAQIADLEAQIQSLMEQKEAAENSKEQSENEVDFCTEQLEVVRGIIQTNESDLPDLNDELNTLEAELIGDGTTEYAQAKQAYEDAKAAYPEKCQEAEDALEVERENVATIQGNIVEINSQLTTAMEEEAEKIEVDTSEESEEFLDDLLELDGIDESEDVEETEESEDVEETDESEDVEETDESEDVEETEESEDVEETEEPEDKKGKIDTLCDMLNMSRQEVGVYLKSIADANNLDAKQMYNKISEFIDETENLDEQTDILSQYGIDSDRAERYLVKQEPNIDYNAENCIDSAIKLFELNITSEDILHSDNPTVQQVIENYNNISSEEEIIQVLTSIEFSGKYYGEQLSTEDQIDLYKEIAKEHPDIVSTYLQSDASYFVNSSITTLLSDENVEMKYCLNQLSNIQDLCGEDYNISDKLKDIGTLDDNGLLLYKKVKNYEDFIQLKEYINPQDIAKEIQDNESSSDETKHLQELFTALSNIQPDASNYEAYGLTEEKANELAAYYDFKDPAWFNASTFAEMTAKYSENEVLYILQNTFPDTNDLISAFRDRSNFSFDEQDTHLGKLAEIYSYNINADEEPSATSEEVETDPSVTEEPSATPEEVETDPSVTEEPPATSEEVETDPSVTEEPPATPEEVETDPSVTEEPSVTSEEVETNPSVTEEPSVSSEEVETDPSVTEEPSAMPEEVTETEFAAALSNDALAQEFKNAYIHLDKNDPSYSYNVQNLVNGIMYPSSIYNEFYETGTELSANDQIYLLKEISKENGDIVQQELRYNKDFAENIIFQMASDKNCTIDDICQFKTEYEELVNGEITLEDKLIEDKYPEIVLFVYEKMETIDDFIKVNEFFNAGKLAEYIQTNRSKEYETDCLRRLFVSLSNVQPDTGNCENYNITKERKLELLEQYNINKDEWFNGSMFAKKESEDVEDGEEKEENFINLPPNEALYVLKNAFPDATSMITKYFRDKNIFSYEDQENYLQDLINIYSTIIQLPPPETEPIIE